MIDLTTLRPGDALEFQDGLRNGRPHWLACVFWGLTEDGTKATVIRCLQNRDVSADELRRPPGHKCDACFVQPDGLHLDGTRCPCSIREPIDGCRCESSAAEWMGPAYVRREIAAEEV